MGPDEAAFAVSQLIKPRSVIPEHFNQVSTSGGTVNAGTKLERFIQQLRGQSKNRVTCDGQGNWIILGLSRPFVIERAGAF